MPKKAMVILWKLHPFLPNLALLAIHKTFIRIHQDYWDEVNEQPHNASFSTKIESVQYNTASAITDA